MDASTASSNQIIDNKSSGQLNFGESWRDKTLKESMLTSHAVATKDRLTHPAMAEKVQGLRENKNAGFSGRQELEETVKLLFAGGFAGAVSKTATAPLARLTILYQVWISIFFQHLLDTAACRYVSGLL